MIIKVDVKLYTPLVQIYTKNCQFWRFWRL